MRFLRQNTAVRITVGPFLDKTDGVTPETALTVTNCKLTLMVDDDDGTAANLILDAAATASGGNNDMVHVTNDDAGFYDLELTAAQTNYLGRAMLAITDAANHCPVFHEFMIVSQGVYDKLFGTYSATRGLAGTALPDAAADAAGGLPISDAGALDMDAVKNNVAAILADTGTDGVVVASGSKTGYSLTATTGLGNQTANITGNLSGSVGSVTGAVGSVTGAVGSVTGAVGSVTGAVGSVTSPVTAGTVSDKTGYKLASDGLDAVVKMKALLDGTPSGSVVDDNDPDPTATAFETDLAEATNDHYNGAFCVFYSGALTGQSRKISDYDGTTKVLTVAAAFTEAPAAGDDFLIIGRSE